MASKNKLLGSGVPYEEEKVEKKPGRFPMFRYSQDFPTGKLFQSEEEVEAAGDGWEDWPVFKVVKEETE